MYSWGNYNHQVESVYKMVPPNANRGQRYVSKYAEKVRDDFNRNKKGLAKTMGQRSIFNQPHRFLKKHTRCSPTFHNQQEQFEEGEEKESTERFVAQDSGSNHTQYPPAYQNQNEQKCLYAPIESLNFRKVKIADVTDEMKEKEKMARLVSERKNTYCHPIFPNEMGESCNEDQANVKAKRLESKNDSNKNQQSRKKFSYEQDEPSGSPLIFDCPNDYPGQGDSDFTDKNSLRVLQTLPSIPVSVPNKKIVDSRNGHYSYVDRPYVLNKNYGRVPAYLQRRKCEEYEKELQIKKDLEASRQRECREIGADERQCIIGGLEQKHEELTQEYYRIPMTSSAPRVLQRKNEIEVRLEAIRKDLILFKGSKKIFVSNKYK